MIASALRSLTVSAGTVLALSASDCSGPTVPMPARSNSADFAILNRTAIDGFAEVYVLLHTPTGHCFTAIEPAGEGGGGITSTDRVVCNHYTRVERK